MKRRETELGMNPKNSLTLAAFALLAMNLTACELVKGIFKAGVWVGVIGVLGVVLLGALAIGAFRR
jgi:hypothetical protein